jgi:hypothetical protein
MKMQRNILKLKGMGSCVPPNGEIIPGLVTAKYLSKMFKKTVQVIYDWRNRKGLPFVIIPGDGGDMHRFNLNKVIAWAKFVSARMHIVNHSTKDL